MSDFLYVLNFQTEISIFSNISLYQQIFPISKPLFYPSKYAIMCQNRAEIDPRRNLCVIANITSGFMVRQLCSWSDSIRGENWAAMWGFRGWWSYKVDNIHTRFHEMGISEIIHYSNSHTGRDGVSNHKTHKCLLNHLFRRRSKKTSKLRLTGLCVGNSPLTAENVSIRWRHHVCDCYRPFHRDLHNKRIGVLEKWTQHYCTTAYIKNDIFFMYWCVEKNIIDINDYNGLQFQS